MRRRRIAGLWMRMVGVAVLTLTGAGPAYGAVAGSGSATGTATAMVVGSLTTKVITTVSAGVIQPGQPLTIDVTLQDSFGGRDCSGSPFPPTDDTQLLVEFEVFPASAVGSVPWIGPQGLKAAVRLVGAGTSRVLKSFVCDVYSEVFISHFVATDTGGLAAGCYQVGPDSSANTAYQRGPGGPQGWVWGGSWATFGVGGADCREFVLDSDGDGLSDDAETRLYRTDPLKVDTDGDGLSDSQEVSAGSDPLDPASPPPNPNAGGGPNGDPARPWPAPKLPPSACVRQMHVVFAVYRSMDAPKTNGCWSWNKLAPGGGGGAGRGRGPWWWCGNLQFIPHTTIYSDDPPLRPKRAAQPGYWVWDDVAQSPSARQLEVMTDCAGWAGDPSTGHPTEAERAATVGWIFTAYRRAAGSGYFMSAGERKAVVAATGADQFVFQLYDDHDFCAGCDHSIATEQLYRAWNGRRAAGGKHSAGIGQLDLSIGLNRANAIERWVKRLCLDSVRDGMISVNASSIGGGLHFGRAQLAPIERAMNACAKTKPD